MLDSLKINWRPGTAVLAMLMVLLCPGRAEAWLAGYSYRKEITIAGTTAGAQTNYQMKITVHKSAGTDSTGGAAAAVYLGNNVQDDFDDVRFTTSSDVVLDHYQESVTSGNNAVFWVEFNSIPASPDTATFYLYFNNNSAASASNGANTFKQFLGADTTDYLVTPAALGTVWRYRAKARISSDIFNAMWGVASVNSDGPVHAVRIQTNSATNENLFYTFKDYYGSATNYTEKKKTPDFNNGQWYMLDITYTAASVCGYVDGAIIVSCNTDDIPVANMGLFQRVHNGQTVGDQAFSFVANYAVPEPTWSAIGTATPSGSLSQEGFRFRDDNGSEAAAAWLAAEDTNLTRTRDTNTRLRVLVDTTDTVPPGQYQLEFKASTHSTYRAVPIEATPAHTYDTAVRWTNANSPSTQSLTLAADATLLVVTIVVEGTTLRAGGAPTYNGIAMTQADSTRGGAGYETSAELWYLVAPPTGSAYTVSIPNTGSRTLFAVASSYKAPAGYVTAFDAANGGAGTAVDPSVTLSPTAAGDVIVGVMGNGRVSAPTAQTGASLYSVDDGAFSDSHQYYLQAAQANFAVGWTVASDDYAIVAAAFKPVMPQPITVSASANIGASGANTTAQLTAPGGKTTAAFSAGRVQDDENPSDSITIGANGYTELEWSLKANAIAVDASVYQFRITANGLPLTTYSVTPQWTIGDSTPAPAAIADAVFFSGD